jgi:hypothetical protein
MSIAPTREHEIALELIDAPTNVRDLDPTHVDVLAASIGLRGLIVPLVVRPAGDRFELVAGFHPHAACARLHPVDPPAHSNVPGAKPEATATPCGEPSSESGLRLVDRRTQLGVERFRALRCPPGRDVERRASSSAVFTRT